MRIGPKIGRRGFLQIGAMAAAYAIKGSGQASPPISISGTSRKKIAAVTAAYSMRSVADNLITRLLQGYWIGNDYHQPQCDVASLYIDRMEPTDVGRRISETYGITVARSISEALTLGSGSLAVDGILIAGGSEYKDTDGALLTHDLRFKFFEQIVEVFRRSGRSVPVFCAGYLSTNWDQAKRMHQWSREMKFPLMAGSSPPVTFRRPDLDYPLPADFDDAPLGDTAHHNFAFGVDFDEALVVCPHGTAAGFCALETLQAFLERRRAGETGIRSLECLLDGAVWRSAQEGRWSKELMQVALTRAEKLGTGRAEDVEHPVLWLIEHDDGTQSAILSLGEIVSEYLAAFRLKGRKEIDSTLCYTPVESANDFSMLAEGFSQMVITGMSPYPVERNLLATGAFLQLSGPKLQNGGRMETPMLQIPYTAPEHSFYARCRGW
jgi:hypothetical protein